MRGGEGGEEGLIFRGDGERFTRIACAEIGAEVDEVGDGDGVVVV